MRYHQVYFNVNCPAYYKGQCLGFQNDEDRLAFDNDCVRLLGSIGWELVGNGRARSGRCCEVTKDGRYLYLHPQQISGVIPDDEISAIEAVLRGASAFRYENTDISCEYFDMTDEEYLSMLVSQKEQIATAVTERFRTKRRNLYIPEYSIYDALGPVRRQFGVKRVGKRDSYSDLEGAYIYGVFQDLLASGEIICTFLKKGYNGYRAATPKDIYKAA